MFNNYNPYYNYTQSQIPRVDQRYYQNMQNQPQGLQGKLVDSLEVVKATDSPWDGSIGYFPLLDNSAIITKQLQMDGTSKIVVYKPVVDNVAEKPKQEDTKVQEEDLPKYVTEEDFKKRLKKIDYTDTINDLTDKINSLASDIEQINKNLNKKKG